MEQTFLMVKPDGIQRGLVGEIISRFERRGFKMVAGKLETLPEARVLEHYAEHAQKPFFPGLKSYIMSGPCFLMVWEGKNVVKISRDMIGATNPMESAPGTIRGDYALEIGMNVIHGSDSVETAKREISIHFTPAECSSYTRIDEVYLYE